MIDGTKLPYSDTNVSIERSKEEINKLLKKFGCKGIQWTWIDNMEILRFMHEYEFEGVEHGITFEINIPDIGRHKGRGYDKIFKKNERQAYRIVVHIIKAKLTAVETGVETFENEFLSKILYQLPDGKTQKVGDVILNQIGKSKPIDLLTG